MARPLHLFRRNGLFYWRRRLPRALVRGTGPDHLCRSLETADRPLARLRALRLSAVFEEALLSHATTLKSAKPLTKYQREQVLFALYDQILEECQAWAAGRTVDIEFLDPEHVDWQMDRYNHPSRQAREWTTFYQNGMYEGAENVLKPLLASHQIDLPADSLEFRSLAAEGMRYAIAAYREAAETVELGELDEGTLARLARRHGRTSAPSPGTSGAPATPPIPAATELQNDDARLPPRNRPLREIYTQFVDDKRRMKAWKDEARDDAWLALYLFEELVGLRKIGEIEHGDAYTFRVKLEQLPKYHGKGPFKRPMRPREAIKKAGAMDAELKDRLDAAVEAGEITFEEHKRRFEEECVPRCGAKTVNKHLDYLGGCIKWCNRHFGWDLPNGFAATRLSKRELNKAGRRRRAMKSEELKRLFESPLFTGCLSENRRSLPGEQILKDSFYWVPLLIAFTGGRLEEICQLTTSDVLEVEGIWCIRISDENEDQEVKTEAAQRIIPLHPTLLKLGFIERVLRLRENAKRRVFPELTPGGRYGRYGYRLTKRWTHYRRQVELYEPGKDFHTLRHSFNTHLLNKKVPIVWMSQLMGHATPGHTAGHAVNLETASTYYGGAEIPQLKEAVQQFDFGLRLIAVDGEWQVAR
ncbi:site-specific integrase [Pelagibius litoralis]|uniref:Site-specific integrase n=1 Tax=Pelagibius litoralis TaxID=374515 RepID=A0A967KGG5_9PROT|nr:site-specific integrase [Pelagibius litoralis]NIA70336.1 site-specific integrase [Pelagibius litoralis]